MFRYDTFKGNRGAMLLATLALAVIIACGSSAPAPEEPAASSSDGTAPPQAQTAPTASAGRGRSHIPDDDYPTGGQTYHGPGGDKRLQRAPRAIGQPPTVRDIHGPGGGGTDGLGQQPGSGTAAGGVLDHLRRFRDLDFQHPRRCAVPQGIR